MKRKSKESKNSDEQLDSKSSDAEMISIDKASPEKKENQ